MVNPNSSHTQQVGKYRVDKKAFRRFDKEGYTIEELEGFYHGLYNAYRSVISQRSDAIIAPLRGAEIFIKTMNLFASLEKKSSLMPHMFYPKTGQINSGVPSKNVKKVNSSFEHSLTESEQKREVRRIVDKIISQNESKRNPKKRVMFTLVDEVWSGGSLTQFVNMLDEIIMEKKARTKIGVNVVSIADSRKVRCPEYIQLKQRLNVKEFVVPRLFTTDSPKFIFPLRKEDVAHFFTMRTPFRSRRIERVFSTQASEGRLRLLHDLETLHNNNSLPGIARMNSMRARLATNHSIAKHKF